METTIIDKNNESNLFSAAQRRRNFVGRFGPGICGLSLLLHAPAVRAVDVLTHMNDNNRSGANTSETLLTPANVNQSSFGKLWSYSVNGATYAQPLYVSGVSIGGGTHNVIYLVTMEDEVYAFDADSNTQYWHVNLNSGSFVPVPIADITGSSSLNIVGDVGVESTPYIDKSGGTMYLLSRSKNTSNTTYHQYLHAMDITSGAEKFGGPVEITASGFNPEIQNQRMGLAKAGNNIIITWTSHEDMHAYHGWIMAYNAGTLAQAAVYNDTPGGSLGGIWQQGRAPAVDASGNIYVITGNGTWDGSQNFGESFLKLNSSLSLLDWFTPDNYNSLNASDEDLGSGGAMLVPGTSLVIGGGKQATLFVLNTGNLGHEQSGNGQIVQHISGFASGEIHGGTVYWNSAANGQLIYNCGNGDHVKSFKFNGSTFGTSPFQTSSASSGGEPGGFLSVSANGNANGIVWAAMGTSDSDHGTVPGIVRAYNADNIGGTELWDSNQNSSRDNVGTFAKDSNPTIANGKVYVGSYSGKVTAYGLLNGGGNLVITNGTFKLINHNSALSAEVFNHATTNNSPVEQWAYSAGNNQKWIVTGVGGGQYKIMGVESGLALQVTGGGTGNGTFISIGTYTGASNQLWAPTATSGGNYRLTPGNATGSGLDVQHSSTANGALLEIWTYNGGNSQQWSFQAP